MSKAQAATLSFLAGVWVGMWMMTLLVLWVRP